MLSHAEDLAFNLSLEILKGCGYSCHDCAIDQSQTSDFMSDADADGLIQLVDDMKAQGYRLHELTLGPTDIISSQSGINVLDLPVVRALAERYSSLTVSLALLLEQDLVEFARKVDQLMAGKKLRIVVPLTLKNARNAKFLELIRHRIGIINSCLSATHLKLVYLTINMHNSSAATFDMSMNQMVQDIDLGVEKLVEYVFPHSRKGLDNLIVRGEFLRDFSTYTQGIHDCSGSQYNRYLIPTPSDSVETTYHNGQLFYTPVLMEKFPILSDAFVIPQPWSAEAMMEYKANLYYDMLSQYADHPTCGDCCFLDQCARGDTQLIMRHITYDGCLLNMKNRWDLTPTTHPVRPDD